MRTRTFGKFVLVMFILFTVALLYFSSVRIRSVKAADSYHEYFFKVLYDPLDTDGDGKNNAIKVTMDVDSNDTALTQTVRVLVVLRDPFNNNCASNSTTWSITGTQIEWASVVVYVPSDRSEGWYDVIPILYDSADNYEDQRVDDNVAYLYPTIPPGGHSVQIWAWSPSGWLTGVPITKDGVSTGLSTPNTFAVTGTHNFTVPSSFGDKSFGSWDTGEVNLALTVASGGAHTALYDAYKVIIEAYEPSGGVWTQISVPITIDGVATGFSTPHDFTLNKTTHAISVPTGFNEHGYPFTSWESKSGFSGNPYIIDKGGRILATYSQPVAVSITPSSWTMDIGQSKTFAATPSGGLGTYADHIWTIDNVPGPQEYTYNFVPVSAGSHNLSFILGSSTPQPNHYFMNGNLIYVTVNSALNTPSATSSASTIYQGQVCTFSVTGLSGGTPPYSYQWLVKSPTADSYQVISWAKSDTCSFGPGYAVNTLGSWSFKVQVTDNASSPVTVTSNPGSVTVNAPPDTTPPTGAITINGGAATTASTSITLTLSATDAESGVTQMRFSNDGSTWSNWEVYATSKSWTLTSGDGLKTVYAQFKNGAGLDSISYSDSITLQSPADTTPPIDCSILINDGAASTSSASVTLSVSAVDAESGVAQMRFSNDLSSWSAWEAYATSKSWTLSSGDGGKTVYVQFRNGVGLDSPAYSDTITLQSPSDITPPSGSIAINGGAATTNSASVVLTLSATDPESGVAQMRVSNDGTSWSSWEAYSTSKAWTLTSGDGAKTVYVQFQNGAGLESTSYSDSINLQSSSSDTTPPTGSIVINGGAATTNSPSVTLTLSATDNSGTVAQMRFANMGESWTTWEPYATTKPWTLTPGTGIRTVLVQFKDGSGLESAPYGGTITLEQYYEIRTFNVTIGTNVYSVTTRSNSSTSDFSFNQVLKRIRFTTNGTAGTACFCNITIPSALMSGDFSLFMDDAQLVTNAGYTQAYNVTHYTFSLSHAVGIHAVEIFATNVVPEYPAAATFVLLLMIASALAFKFGRRIKPGKIPSE